MLMDDGDGMENIISFMFGFQFKNCHPNINLCLHYYLILSFQSIHNEVLAICRSVYKINKF